MACEFNCIDKQVFNPVLKKHEPCPNCSDAGDIFDKPVEKQKDILRSLNIPDGFDLTMLFDEQLLRIQSVNMSFSQDSIQYLRNKMIEMNTAVLDRRVLKESLYLYTPAVDIKAFAYALMVKGVEQGLRVSPLISVNTLYDIQRSREFDYGVYGQVYTGDKLYDTLGEREKQFYEGYLLLKETGKSYRDFIDSDILFLEATANTSNASWVAVADILAERATRNKPTYILGYWSSRQLQSSNAKYVLQTADWAKRLSKLTVVELVSKKYETAKTGQEQPYYGVNGRGQANTYAQPYKAPQPTVTREAISQHIQNHTSKVQNEPQQQTFGIQDLEGI